MKKIIISPIRENLENKFKQGALYISIYNTIILCTEDSTLKLIGVVLNKGDIISSEGTLSNWNTDIFKEFHGTILLEN